MRKKQNYKIEIIGLQMYPIFCPNCEINSPKSLWRFKANYWGEDWKIDCCNHCIMIYVGELTGGQFESWNWKTGKLKIGGGNKWNTKN